MATKEVHTQHARGCRPTWHRQLNTKVHALPRLSWPRREDCNLCKTTPALRVGRAGAFACTRALVRRPRTRHRIPCLLSRGSRSQQLDLQRHWALNSSSRPRPLAVRAECEDAVDAQVSRAHGEAIRPSVLFETGLSASWKLTGWRKHGACSARGGLALACTSGARRTKFRQRWL